MSLAKLDAAIKRLKGVINDPFCKNMNLSNVKGYLGELIVYKKLISEGFQVIQKGNQSAYDIEIPSKRIKIDVKLSTIKSEVKNCPNYWGWALKFERRKKPVNCTHFICVSLDEELNPLNYYVIRNEHLLLFPKSAIPQFKNVAHGFVLLTDAKRHMSIIDVKVKGYFDTCATLLAGGHVQKVKASNKLSKWLT